MSGEMHTTESKNTISNIYVYIWLTTEDSSNDNQRRFTERN
jgi:hypothetical protein